jgi:hypothetical protein
MDRSESIEFQYSQNNVELFKSLLQKQTSQSLNCYYKKEAFFSDKKSPVSG